MSKKVEMMKQAMAEGFSEGVDDSMKEQREVLDRYISSTGAVSSHKEDILKALFSRAKSGDYTTRSQTLVEKTASVLKK